MIWHSSYWKEELTRCAHRLEHRQFQKRWVKGIYAGLEKDVMLGFYSFRKLVDARQVSNVISDQ